MKAIWLSLCTIAAFGSEEPKLNSLPPPDVTHDFLTIDNIHGTVMIETDFIFRGISFSGHLPFALGSILYNYKGLFMGITGFNTNLSAGGIGLEPIIGYNLDKKDWSLDGFVHYFVIPSYTTTESPEMLEFLISYTYKTKWVQPSVGLAFSPNFSFRQGTGWFPYAKVDVLFPQRFTLQGSIGCQTTVKGHSEYWFRNYLTWTVSLFRDFKGFSLGINYNATNLSKKDCNGRNAAIPTLVGTLETRY